MPDVEFPIGEPGYHDAVKRNAVARFHSPKYTVLLIPLLRDRSCVSPNLFRADYWRSFRTDLLRPGQDLPQVEYLQRSAQRGHISKEAFDKIAWRNADQLLGLGLA